MTWHAFRMFRPADALRLYARSDVATEGLEWAAECECCNWGHDSGTVEMLFYRWALHVAECAEEKVQEKVFGLRELNRLPTIREGHMDDLKIDGKTVRVWLSRMTKEDGMPFDNAVTVEVLRKPGWVTIACYEAK